MNSTSSSSSSGSSASDTFTLTVVLSVLIPAVVSFIVFLVQKRYEKRLDMETSKIAIFEKHRQLIWQLHLLMEQLNVIRSVNATKESICFPLFDKLDNCITQLIEMDVNEDFYQKLTTLTRWLAHARVYGVANSAPYPDTIEQEILDLYVKYCNNKIIVADRWCGIKLVLAE